jgi:hypothetical protein
MHLPPIFPQLPEFLIHGVAISFKCMFDNFLLKHLKKSLSSSLNKEMEHKKRKRNGGRDKKYKKRVEKRMIKCSKSLI